MHMTPIAFLGDSNTARIDWNAELGRHDCLQHGRNGDTTSGIFQRVKSVIDTGARIAIINGGKNDADAEIPPETIAANLINTAGTLRLAGIFPVIIAPYKVSADCQNFKFLNKRLTDAARYLEHLAPGNIIDYFDLSDPWLSPTGVMKAELVDPDGVHFNAQGRKQVGALVKYYLLQRGWQTVPS